MHDAGAIGKGHGFFDGPRLHNCVRMLLSVNTGTLSCVRQALQVNFQIRNRLRKLARSGDRVSVCLCVCYVRVCAQLRSWFPLSGLSFPGLGEPEETLQWFTDRIALACVYIFIVLVIVVRRVVHSQMDGIRIFEIFSSLDLYMFRYRIRVQVYWVPYLLGASCLAHRSQSYMMLDCMALAMQVLRTRGALPVFWSGAD